MCRPPSGAWLGGPGRRGAGGRSASVRPSASLGRAPKRALLASLSSWRVWSPYCSGSCPRAATRIWSAGRPCTPARDCKPVGVTVGVGGWQFGGAWRMGPVALLPGCRSPLGGGGAPLARRGGYRANVPLAGLQHPAGWVGGEGGERRGGVAPEFPITPLRSPGSFPRRLRGGGLKVPAATSPTAGCVAPRVPPCNALGRGCLESLGAGRDLGSWLLVVSPCPHAHPCAARAARGGRVCVPPSLGGVVGGPLGAGGWGLLCLGQSLCLPRVGTKASFIGVAQSMEGVVSILFWFVSAGCRLGAVREVPLRAGAGPQACVGHCGSGQVAVWGRVVYGPSGAPPWVPRPSRGGGGLPWPGGGGTGLTSHWQASGFLGAGGGEGGDGGARVRATHRPPPDPRCLSPAAAGGGWLKGLGQGPPYGRWCGAARPSLLRGRPGLVGVPGLRARPGGSAAGGSVPAVTPTQAPCGWPGGGGDGRCGPRFSGSAPGGGAPQAAGPHSPPALLPVTGRPAVVWAFAHGRPAPRVAAVSSHGTGGGGGAAGAGAGGPVQQLAVSGLRVSGTPLSRASACAAPLAHAQHSRARGLRRLHDRG